MLAASIDYTTVIVALIAAIPATVAAYAALRNGRALKTPSKTSIGKQVEDALQTAIANNFRLQGMAHKLDVRMPDRAAAVEDKVVALNQIQTRAERAEASRRSVPAE